MSRSRIYLSAPHMGEHELRFVHEAFETNWLSSVGPHIDAFERELAEVVGGHVCALASGTAALHLALRLLGVGPGDEVFCPTLTFVATANPIVYQGARPVFLDSERTSWNLDPNVLEAALAHKAAQNRLPKALIVVHLFGQSADMRAILALARRYDVPVVEDAAEALGTLYEGQQVGAMGDVGVLSFNGNKIITTTSGGALISRDESKVKKARFWSTQARDPSIAYEHSELGYNYRMSNVLAGIGRGQLRVLPDRVRRRREIAVAYRDALGDLPGLELMPQADWGLHTNWLSVFLVDEARLGVSRDALVHALAAEDIEARPVWKPMHTQVLYESAERFGGTVAEDLYARGICLPSSTNMRPEDQARVIEALRRAAGRG
jgi:pyridoxal phosphate-dependent aminotransferase EpsN